MARSVAWFERAGFEASFHDETYAFAHRDRDLTIHLAQAEGDDPPGQRALYIHCQEADRVAKEWRQAGIKWTAHVTRTMANGRAPSPTLTET